MALHEAESWTAWLMHVCGGNDGDRFALVGDGDGLVGLLYFEEELLKGFREFYAGYGHGFLGFRECVSMVCHDYRRCFLTIDRPPIPSRSE